MGAALRGIFDPCLTECIDEKRRAFGAEEWQGGLNGEDEFEACENLGMKEDVRAE